ncbi:MAG: RIP metalloprotease RseP [Candidatus Acidiferrales bacterium]
MTDTLRILIAGGVVLGILVLLHEWGHFIAAKWCGVRVDVFSIGFGPRLWGIKRGDTDYRISALPLGGYVRMAGDNPVEERTGAPYEFLSRPRWQRCIIAIAGPAMNILLTFFVFMGVFWLVGIPTPSYFRQTPDVIAVPHNASASGVMPGDRIVKVNGVETPNWRAVFAQSENVKPGDSLSVVVLRNGAQTRLTVAVTATSTSDDLFGYPLMQSVLDEVLPGTPADKAGLQSGDVITSIDGHAVVTWPQFVDAVHSSEGREIHFNIQRNGHDLPLSVTPARQMDPDGKMVWQVGVLPGTQDYYERESFVASIKNSFESTVNGVRQIGNVLGGLASGKVSVRDLQGVIGIARESGRAAKRGPVDLIFLAAVISLNLGLLNLLPIPILDGGHVLMLAIEGTMRRDLSITFKERFVQVGLVFLLGLFAFVMYSDIMRIIQTHH